MTITATSQGDATRSDTAQLTTTVAPVYGLNLSPNDASSGRPGTTVTYTLTISNSGNVADTFSLAVAGNSWLTSVSTTSVTLLPDASSQFSVTVSVPPGALVGDADAVTITATSQGDAAKSESTLLTTTVLPAHGVLLSPDQARQGPAGQTITFSLWITNTGNLTDTFDLTATGQTWTTTLSVSQISLSPATSGMLTVTVAVPADAIAQEVDSVTVTATSQSDHAVKDSSILNAKCVLPIQKIYLPAILQIP